MLEPLYFIKNITWVYIPAKEGILLVTSHVCLTYDSDTILLGRFTNEIEDHDIFLG